MILNFIHHTKQTERWESINREMREQDILEYHAWPAIVDLMASFRGIAQAHKQIVRYAMHRQFKEVCIAEDDIKFLAPGAWDYFLAHKPADFDLYLGSIFHGDIKEDGSVDNFAGLTLYIISERFYDTFLALNEMNHIDRELAHKGRYIVCDKMVCSQHGGFSLNKQSFVEDYDHYLEGRTLFTG